MLSIHEITLDTNAAKADFNMLTEKLKAIHASTHTLGRTKNYSELLDFYISIAEADFHIIDNKGGLIDKQMAHSIIAGMRHHKPIIVLEPPIYQKDVTLFERQIIDSRLNKLTLCNLRLLDSNDLEIVVNGISKQAVNYVLTKHEMILISSILKQTFRLLEQNTV